MKKLIVAGAGFAALIAEPVLAADLVPTPPPAIYYYDWTGLYAGASVGLGSSFSSIDLAASSLNTSGLDPFGTGPQLTSAAQAAVPNLLATHPFGFIGGIQIGYNAELRSRWVIGFETDFSYTAIKGTDRQQGQATSLIPFAVPLNLANATAVAGGEQRLDWLGTARVRLGFVPTERLLIYATTGLAYGQVNVSANLTETGCVQSGAFPTACSGGPAQGSGSASQIRVGWAAGAGFEYALGEGWNAKAEYVHWDLGQETVSLSTLVLPVTLPIVVVPPTRPLAATVNAQGSTHLYGDILRVGLTYKFGDYSTPW